jgi:inner membrane protein involved in colicin E2 resistance
MIALAGGLRGECRARAHAVPAPHMVGRAPCRRALAFAAMLGCLFAFLYVLLGLETYSLLLGALALFAVVSALMVLTQKVSWPGRVAVEGAV